MIKTDGIIRIDIPETLVTPATVEALILAHRGIGVHADDPDRERKECQDDLKLFLTWVEANGIKADDAVIQIIRAEERPDILRVSSVLNDYLFFKTSARDDDDKTYEYIESITLWMPGKEAVRPEEHLMIAPPMYLDEARFVQFLLRAGFSATNYAWLVDIVKNIIDDYPIGHGADRPRLFASRLFNIVRIDTPMKNDFKDQSGALIVEIMVADKGSWSRAGRLRITTGWKDLGGVSWGEAIVSVERPKGDEPEEHAMPYKAGVYQYINIGEGEGEPTIHAAEPELRNALKQHLTAASSAELTQHYQMLTSPSNPEVIPGKIGYRLCRLYGPGLVGGPTPIGQVRLELFTGERFVGALNLNTVFLKPVNGLTLMDGLVNIDYVETVDRVALDADTSVRMGSHHGQRRGWGGLGGQHWGGGWSGMGGQHRFGQGPQGPQFTQQHAWGPAMQTPFMEEAKLSTFNLDSYGRILKALIENIRTLDITVTDVLARMYVVREQVNPQAHGQLMYQFEFNMMHGLLMRAVSQSGVVHLQQVVPMDAITPVGSPTGRARWS
jgi:hypothetical protein